MRAGASNSRSRQVPVVALGLGQLRCFRRRVNSRDVADVPEIDVRLVPNRQWHHASRGVGAIEHAVCSGNSSLTPTDREEALRREFIAGAEHILVGGPNDIFTKCNRVDDVNALSAEAKVQKVARDEPSDLSTSGCLRRDMANGGAITDA